MHALLLGDVPFRCPATHPHARRVLAVGLGAHPLVECLEQRGLAVRRHADPATLLMAAGLDAAEIIIGTFGQGGETESLPAFHALARLMGVTILLVGFEPSDDAWRRATALTPLCYPASLSGDVLASLVIAGLERFSVAARQAQRVGPRLVALRPWESVEVDGVPIYLGVAERNFLFLLASRPGERLSKDEDIDVGGRTLPASTCRRRLGQRLGPELAELLIPQERFEPYRLRSPAEIERLSQGAAGRHLPTVLRIHGRGSVFSSAAGRMERVATVA
jgi:hypothetical protein